MVVDAGCVTQLAIASVPISTAGAYLERFGPDLLVVEDYRREAVPAAPVRVPAVRLWRLRDWNVPRRRPPNWPRAAGGYAHNAWKLAVTFVLRYRGVRDLHTEYLSPEWLDEHGRRRAADP